MMLSRLTRCAAVAALAAANLALLSFSHTVRAEDTDIFTVNPAITALRPNVLIMLDNTANWNTPFTAEKSALVSTVNGVNGVGGLDDRFNVGLMAFVETGNPNDNTDGSYVRSHVRQMTSTNKTALANMVQNLDITYDKGNNATYGLAMAEIYRYFGGLTSVSGFGKVKRDYPNNSLPTGGNNANNNPALAYSNTLWALSGNHAYANSTSATYVSPIADNCAKNFVIFISNGPANDNNSATTTATTALTGYGGSAAEITLSPNGSQSNVADEWARYLANTDVNATAPLTQSVVTYTVDVNPGTNGQGPGHTALLKSMALQGKGKYFAVQGNTAAIADALNQIFQEVLAVNSVFAAATLPASVNTRGTFLNQVYMGVFRPDSNASPRWDGNLKQYKTAPNSAGKLELVDSAGAAVEDQTSGFLKNNITSFWTGTSTFWNSTYYPDAQGVGGVSDAPDGNLVEKGGAAQRLRTVFGASPTLTNRKLYTCTGACAAASSLMGYAFDTGNPDIDATALGITGLTNKDELIRWMRGENRLLNDNPASTPAKTDVRGYLHGDVVHSRPAIVNYNANSPADDNDVVVFYGSNDGIFHAVQGGRASSGGNELWGFVAKEFFTGLNRLYAEAPVINNASASTSKPYFMDGPIATLTIDANSDGKLLPANNDKAYLYVSARRGGRFIYALDVSDRNDPKLLWKIDNTTAGFAELGQTWAEPKVGKLKGYTNPVLFITAGYDAAANDQVTQGTATMGRGVYIVDAITGAPLWHAGAVAVALPPLSMISVPVVGMNFAIPADAAVIDSDSDGFVDRLYLADTGGNIWRVNLDATYAAKSTWTVRKLAELGGTGVNARKFLFAPDVVAFDGPPASKDSILIGSGDRERPFDTAVTNRFYMVRDTHDFDPLIITGVATVTQANLYDASADLIQVGDVDQKAAATTSLAAASGWYVTLGTGEKTVTPSITLNGSTVFGTNVPESQLAVNNSTTCSSGLGEARLYTLNFKDATAVLDQNANNVLSLVDRYAVKRGGGLLPPPVAISVEIDGKFYEGVQSGPTIITPPGASIGPRSRVYWNILNESN